MDGSYNRLRNIIKWYIEANLSNRSKGSDGDRVVKHLAYRARGPGFDSGFHH